MDVYTSRGCLCWTASSMRWSVSGRVRTYGLQWFSIRAVSLALILPHGLPVGVRQAGEPCDAFLVCRVRFQRRVVAVCRHNLCHFRLQRQRRPLSLAPSSAVLTASVCDKNEMITLSQVLRGDFCFVWVPKCLGVPAPKCPDAINWLFVVKYVCNVNNNNTICALTVISSHAA